MTLTFHPLAVLSGESNIDELDMEPLPGLSSLGSAGTSPSAARVRSLCCASRLLHFLQRQGPPPAKRLRLMAWHQTTVSPAVPCPDLPRPRILPWHRRGLGWRVDAVSRGGQTWPQAHRAPEWLRIKWLKRNEKGAVRGRERDGDRKARCPSVTFPWSTATLVCEGIARDCLSRGGGGAGTDGVACHA